MDKNRIGLGHSACANDSQKAISRILLLRRAILAPVNDRHATPSWTFLTNHARVLVCIGQDPGVRLREIGERVGITERAAHGIVVELAAAGYITRRRDGRRNHYTINAEVPLHDPIAPERNVGQLLEILIAADRSEERVHGTGTSA